MPENSDRDCECYSQFAGELGVENALSETRNPRQISPIPLVRAKVAAETYPKCALGPLTPAVDAVVHLTSAPSAQSIFAAASLATQNLAVVETLQSAKPVSVFFCCPWPNPGNVNPSVIPLHCKVFVNLNEKGKINTPKNSEPTPTIQIYSQVNVG